MPFHVEISSPVNRARVVNLDEVELRRTVLEPWVSGLPFEFGGEEWVRADGRLTVLESSTSAPASGAADETWAGVLRGAEDVTRPLLEAAEASAPTQTAVVVEADSVEAALKELRTGGAPQRIPWSTAIERIDGQGPELAAVILVVKRSGFGFPRL